MVEVGRLVGQKRRPGEAAGHEDAIEALVWGSDTAAGIGSCCLGKIGLCTLWDIKCVNVLKIDFNKTVETDFCWWGW